MDIIKEITSALGLGGDTESPPATPLQPTPGEETRGFAMYASSLLSMLPLLSTFNTARKQGLSKFDYLQSGMIYAGALADQGHAGAMSQAVQSLAQLGMAKNQAQFEKMQDDIKNLKRAAVSQVSQEAILEKKQELQKLTAVVQQDKKESSEGMWTSIVKRLITPTKYKLILSVIPLLGMYCFKNFETCKGGFTSVIESLTGAKKQYGNPAKSHGGFLGEIDDEELDELKRSRVGVGNPLHSGVGYGPVTRGPEQHGQNSDQIYRNITSFPTDPIERQTWAFGKLQSMTWP